MDLNPERPISVLSFNPITHRDRSAGFIFDLNEPSRNGPWQAVEYDVYLSRERYCGNLCEDIRYDEIVILGPAIRRNRTPELSVPDRGASVRELWRAAT